MPGTAPATYDKHYLWAVLTAMGQLCHHLIRPFRRTPLSLGQLVDERQPWQLKLSVGESFRDKPPCCVDASVEDILPNGKFATKLCIALRGKNVNVEIEDNLARATNQRAAMRGKAHDAASLIAKHVSAEIVLGHKRDLKTQPPDPTAALLKELEGSELPLVVSNSFKQIPTNFVVTRRPTTTTY
jgi:hypothetical protein